MSGKRWPLLAAFAMTIAFVPHASAVTQRQWVARVGVSPPAVRLGERATYRGYVVVDPGVPVRWLPPQNDDALTWGPRRAARSSRFDGGGPHRALEDTIKVEVPLQPFRLGRIDIPGLGVLIGPGPSAATYRLPTTTITVLPMISPADSQATLKPVRGPLAAPWWERVPWIWVIAGLLLIAILILVIRRLRRRRPAAPEVAAPSLSPTQIALASLAELRQLRLPENDRMAEHAFRLGQILRRYLEATTRTTLPGHTTPELVRGLTEAGLSAEDLKRLTGLLRVWDRVKFARAPITVEEALRSEQAVEAFVRRPAVEPAPQQGAA